MLVWLLKFLSGGVLKSVLGHLESKAKTETERDRIKSQVAIEEIRAEIARRSAQKDIIVAQLGHPVAWAPRFLAELTATLYFMAIVIDAMFQLPGDISELPAPVAAVMATIFGGMFLKEAVGRTVEKVTKRWQLSP